MDLNDEPQCIADATSQGAQRTQEGMSTGSWMCVRTVLGMQKVQMKGPEFDMHTFNESKYHCPTNSN